MEHQHAAEDAAPDAAPPAAAVLMVGVRAPGAARTTGAPKPVGARRTPENLRGQTWRGPAGARRGRRLRKLARRYLRNVNPFARSFAEVARAIHADFCERTGTRPSWQALYKKLRYRTPGWEPGNIIAWRRA